MIDRCHPCLLPILLLAFTCLPVSGGLCALEAPVPTYLPLTLSIVPTSTSNGEAAIELDLHQPSHFHVVLHNIATTPVVLWREWCSWGWFNLRFIASDPSGTTWTIVKQPRGWDRNYPDPITLAPNGDLVIDVSFAAQDWVMPPLLQQPGVHRIVLQAIYHSANERMGQGAWDGTLVSERLPYLLRR